MSPVVDKYDAPLTYAAQGTRRFHVMAKPAGSRCNLDCTYCFYLSKETLPGGPGAADMDRETLELFIRNYIAGVTGPEVVFSWQGGEPTLRGLAFFEEVVALQRRYAKPGQRVENDLQTNGVLIDESWARFLKQHGFLVGLSIDGPRELHDAYRVNKGGAPTFDKVMAAAGLLRRFGVPFATLTCVHRGNARRPLDIYRFLRRELDARAIQFIPIVEARGFEATAPQAHDPARLPRLDSPEARPGHPDSIVTDWSVDPDDYGYFLSRVFDEWRRKDLGTVLVNHFETLVAQHLGLPSQICIYGEFCGKAVAVEHDGSVYSCDHYVYPEYRLGTIRETPLADLVLSRRQVKFGWAKSETLPAYCRGCDVLSDCRGECPKNRLIRTPDGEPGLNYLCAGLKRFFRHARPEVDRIAADIRARTPTVAGTS
ncbi:anaerobic sulfatase maturase [Rhodoplanes roseus]|uniref:Anaerobic sulfatase maturase n=1 Tax=Rhodoplanes roseus TaxID=29409 RepID=A0A327L560_9BRAD|nr:anaerobic sulfatase maturase [Rhodoplanes roseus]RAI44672.1 anaerobic sulfatase maturase [Rhodoplanes roseus]